MFASLLGIVALTGHTPSPASPAAKPLRHLQYTFSVDYEGVTERHYNGIGNGIRTSSGLAGGPRSEGGHGTMTVDMLSLTPDGALSVQISEWVQNEPRARQAYTCTVYGDTSVVCPSVPAPSQAEWVLLSYFGRRFVDGAPWDSNHHWQRKVDTPQYVLTEDFALANASESKSTLIRENKNMEMHDGGLGSRTEDVTITYDRLLEVPDAVHDEMNSIGASGSSHSTFDFHLSSDSFAAPPQ